MAVTVAASILTLVMLRAYTSTPSLAKQTPGGTPATRPTLPSEMIVDKPVNTAYRSEKKMVGATGDLIGDIHRIANTLESTYSAEAASHPGVQLAASAVVH